MERNGILCAGCVLVDIVKTIDRWPPEEQVAMIDRAAPQCGGPGLNLALDLAKLGARFPVSVAGVVGADTYGGLIRATCNALGVDASALRIASAAATSYTDVMVVRQTGRRTFFHSVGANAELAEADVPIERSSARILHLGSPGLHALLDAADDRGETGFFRLLSRAQAAGMKTNLELVSLPRETLAAFVRPLLPLLSSIIINDIEAEALTGISIEGAPALKMESAERAAQALLDLGIAERAAIHFPEGAAAAQRGGPPARKPSVRVPPEAIISSNGAGDAFAAGMMLGWHEGFSLQACLTLAHAAAAASLRNASTFEGVMSQDECLALAEQWGWR
jgi:sugar/nucleoside kinase (ribokinase family)